MMCSLPDLYPEYLYEEDDFIGSFCANGFTPIAVEKELKAIPEFNSHKCWESCIFVIFLALVSDRRACAPCSATCRAPCRAWHVFVHHTVHVHHFVHLAVHSMCLCTVHIVHLPLQRRRGSVVYEQGTFSKFNN